MGYTITKDQIQSRPPVGLSTHIDPLRTQELVRIDDVVITFSLLYHPYKGPIDPLREGTLIHSEIQFRRRE